MDRDDNVRLDALDQLLRQADNEAGEILTLLADEEPHEHVEMNRRISNLSQRYQGILSAMILLEGRHGRVPKLRRQQRVELAALE